MMPAVEMNKIGIVLINTVRRPRLSITRIAIMVPRSLTKANGKFKIKLSVMVVKVGYSPAQKFYSLEKPAKLIKVGP